MREALKYLFPFCLLVLCVMRPSRAEAPDLAVCKDGHCVMTEADYKKLQSFVVQLMLETQRANINQERAEHRADSCQAFLKDHHA